VKAVRHGGVLVFATGSTEQVDGAAQIMNRHRAAQVEELSGSEPSLPSGSSTMCPPLPEVAITPKGEPVSLCGNRHCSPLTNEADHHLTG
jgi:hypothetical protein